MDWSKRALLIHSWTSKSNCFSFLFFFLFFCYFSFQVAVAWCKQTLHLRCLSKTNSAFCLSNIILGLVHGRPFFHLQDWDCIKNAKDFAYGLLNQFIFFVTDTQRCSSFCLFFSYDAIACIWNFLLIIKLSKILMLKQYLERC